MRKSQSLYSEINQLYDLTNKFFGVLNNYRPNNLARKNGFNFRPVNLTQVAIDLPSMQPCSVFLEASRGDKLRQLVTSEREWNLTKHNKTFFIISIDIYCSYGENYIGQAVFRSKQNFIASFNEERSRRCFEVCWH